MWALDLPVRTGAEAARLVRALGGHRYVRGRMHLVHAFAVDAASGASADAAASLASAAAWAAEVLGKSDIDPSSRDERLWRPCSEAEVAAVLDVFWGGGAAAAAARGRLEGTLRRCELDVPAAGATVFDEVAEDDLHPVLVDAGWELLGLAELDAERHKGVIDCFGDAVLFEAAKFVECESIPRPTYLQELPALGAAELMFAAGEDGVLADELPLWAEGPEAYHTYLLRGVCRAARLGQGAPGN